MKKYCHNERYTVAGAERVLKVLFDKVGVPDSMLDIGCGVGTWMAAALNLGCSKVHGLEGTVEAQDKLYVPRECISGIDLEGEWTVSGKYDLIVSMEVAEHLTEKAANRLMDNACHATDKILFSAAIPGQPGQNHISCKWQSDWEAAFNNHSFQCHDFIRWAVWNDENVEPWYRQNAFLARRTSAKIETGCIPNVIHPEVAKYMDASLCAQTIAAVEKTIREGGRRVTWYPSVFFRGMLCKVRRRLAGR